MRTWVLEQKSFEAKYGAGGDLCSFPVFGLESLLENIFLRVWLKDEKFVPEGSIWYGKLCESEKKRRNGVCMVSRGELANI